MWSGSKVAVLTSDELRFVEATKAYNTGKPVRPTGLQGRLAKRGNLGA
jgi:hypothetical protein